MTASAPSILRIGRSESDLRSWALFATVTLIAAAALIFDALTPQVVSVTTLYTCLVLAGYWFVQPTAALALALVATPLIIIGQWLSIPENTPEWQSWMNRGISLGDVWLVAVFVWRIRVLGQKVQRQIDVANSHARESALLASIVESSDDAIIGETLDGTATSWNSSAERLFGYVAEEVVGKPATAILLPPERHHEEDMILAHIQRGERVDHFETVRRHKNGILVDISLTVSPIRTAEGTLVGASEIARDITVQKRVEHALRDSEERLRVIFDGSSQYIGLTSPDGTVLEANHASLGFAGDAFGRKREHVVGRPLWEGVWFVHTAGEPERLREAIARAAAGEFVRYEVSLLRPSGEERIFDLSLHPIRNAQGDVRLIVPQGSDITDRKRAEEALAKSEARFKASVLRSPVPTVLFDDREQVLAVSKSWLTAAGGVRAEDFRRMEDWTNYFFGERSGEILDRVRRIMATEPQELKNERVLTVGGERRIWTFVTSDLGAGSDGRRLFISRPWT